MAALPRHLAWFASHRLGLVTGFINPVPAGRCRFHSHVHLELVFHRSGQGTSRVASGADLPFAPGQATLYPPGVLHDQRNEVGGDDICLHLDAGPRPPPLLARAHVATVPAPLVHELPALATAPAERSAADQLALDLRATAAVLALLAGAGDAAWTAYGGGHAGLAARYLAEHLATVGRMAEVARHVSISEDRLRHVFTATYGIGLVEYLTRLRIGKAKELLQGTELGLNELARACGFATARYLCTIFRQRLGCAPGEWRRRSRLNAAARPRRTST